jgi:putative membrane protein
MTYWMTNRFTRLLYTWIILAVGVVVSAHVVPGISYANGASLVVAVLLLSLLNMVLKPILVLFTLPFIVLTMGIGILLINAFLFLIVGRLVEGFQVAGFGSAFLGSLIVSLLSLFINFLFFGRANIRVDIQRGGGAKRSTQKRFRGKDDDVIDI